MEVGGRARARGGCLIRYNIGHVFSRTSPAIPQHQNNTLSDLTHSLELGLRSTL